MIFGGYKPCNPANEAEGRLEFGQFESKKARSVKECIAYEYLTKKTGASPEFPQGAYPVPRAQCSGVGNPSQCSEARARQPAYGVRRCWQCLTSFSPMAGTGE